MQRIYTVEELMLDDSFVSFCLDKKAAVKDFWEKEMELRSDQKSVFAEARYTIMLLHGKLDDNEVNRQLEKIRNLISEQEKNHFSTEKFQEPLSLRPKITEHYNNQKSTKHLSKSYLLYGIAALALIFAGGYLFKYTASKATLVQPNLVKVFNKSGMGERKSIRLPDGSVAVLNSNSSITYRGDFNQNKRTIILSGEAFFSVAKNPAKPFIVHSGTFSVTALGTSFYVHARNNAENYKVELLEGKVRLASNEDKTKGSVTSETMLLPGEEAAWQSSKMSFTKTSCDSAVLKKWVSGKLSFKTWQLKKYWNCYNNGTG